MDYYQTLGVVKTATAQEIKQAYRKLASKHHPDKSGGDTAKFQQIEEAYRILSDEQKRSEYDNPHAQFGGFPNGFNFDFNGSNPFEDLLHQFARQHKQQRQRAYSMSIFINLEQIATGSTEIVQIQTDTGSKTFEIKIPKAIEDGQRVRYDNLMTDGPVLVTFRIRSHPIFQRRGLDLWIETNVNVFDLILGTTIEVPTIYGKMLEITIKSGTRPGSSLRIANYGLDASNRRGDQYLLINCYIPDTISSELKQALESERQNLK
jgi:DnaJ-class molecular chaperone